jgi:hypothetical protein
VDFIEERRDALHLVQNHHPVRWQVSELQA